MVRFFGLVVIMSSMFYLESVLLNELCFRDIGYGSSINGSMFFLYSFGWWIKNNCFDSEIYVNFVENCKIGK